MAILSKIRDRSLFLILIIGMALFAFVASPKQIMNFFRSNKANSVGTVNGEHITIEEFNAQIEQYKNRFGDVEDDQATKYVWEEMVSERIFDEQFYKSDMVIGEKDVWNAIISDPSINSSPLFINDSGLFDEELLKSYIAELKDDDTREGKQKWANWMAFDNDVAKNVRRKEYFNAIAAGMGYTVEEAKEKYNEENTRVSGKYVLVPFRSIPDSTVTVTEKEIEKYINDHEEQFKTFATRDVRFVNFPISASEEDKAQIKAQVAALLNDKEEYDKDAENGVRIIKGFADTDDLSAFISEYSDVPENTNYIFKTNQPKDSIFDMAVGSIFGPYEEQGYYKLSKVVEKKDVQEAQASHILISFKETGNPNATITKEEAKAKADAILTRLKAGADFATEAQTNSEDPGSATRGGSLGWFDEGRMVTSFNDWVFSHSKGQMGIVESQYGYHIIKLEDKRTKPGIKLATVARLIEPSDKTLNNIFIEAESFASAVQKDPKDFAKIAEERGLTILKAENLSRGTSMITGISSPASQISYWTFDQSVEKGDTRRFDLEKSYAVAQLTGIQKEGTMSIKNAEPRVKPILMQEKKAALLLDKLSNGNLTEIAANNGVIVMNVNDATILDPPSELSYDKSVLAAMTQMEEGTILRNVVGKNGVYAVQLDSKMEPAALSSYEATRYQMEQNVKANDMTIYNALKEASDVGEFKL